MFIKLDFQACTTPTIVVVIANRIAVIGLLNITPVRLTIDLIAVRDIVLKPVPIFLVKLNIAAPVALNEKPPDSKVLIALLNDIALFIKLEVNFANLPFDNCKEAEKERKKLVTLFPSPSIFNCL